MELFIGEFFLRSLCYCIGYLFYCITIDFYSTTSTTAGFTVLTTCLHNACLAVKARFWNFNKNDHCAVSSSSVLYSYRSRKRKREVYFDAYCNKHVVCTCVYNSHVACMPVVLIYYTSCIHVALLQNLHTFCT